MDEGSYSKIQVNLATTAGTHARRPCSYASAISSSRGYFNVVDIVKLCQLAYNSTYVAWRGSQNPHLKSEGGGGEKRILCIPFTIRYTACI